MIGGIAIGHAFTLDVQILVDVLAVIAVAALILVNRQMSCTLLLLVASVIIGVCLVTIEERKNCIVLTGDYASYETIVVEEPVDKGRNLILDLLITSGQYDGCKVRALLGKDSITNNYKNIAVGDGLHIHSKLKYPVTFPNSNFDYVTYLKGRGIVAVAFVSNYDWKKTTPRVEYLSSLERTRLKAMKFRHKLMEQYGKYGLYGQDFAVVSAMTLGDKSAVSEETRNSYSVTGAAHILALSGMHLGIIYSLLSFLLLGRKYRNGSELLLIVAIWIYTFMVGMSPSVVRAAVMLSVYTFVGLTGRQRMSINALAFAAILMLAYNPLCLYDIGFELSFMAVAFILMYNLSVSSLVPLDFQQRHPYFRVVWQLLCMSTVAQLGTLPLIVYYFGRIPVYAILTNFIVIPAAALIIYMSVCVLILSFWPFACSVVVRGLVLVVSSLNSSMLAISKIPRASIEGIHVSALQIALSYVIIFVVMSYCRLYLQRARKIA